MDAGFEVSSLSAPPEACLNGGSELAQLQHERSDYGGTITIPSVKLEPASDAGQDGYGGGYGQAARIVSLLQECAPRVLPHRRERPPASSDVSGRMPRRTSSITC
jgi:hypothetical protein